MVAASRSDDKISVFISYSREDLAFADQVDAALRLHEFDIVLDRKGISGGEEWQPRLSAMIRDSDTVVFVLSPASTASPVCEWEAAEAVRLGKRIVPILCGPLGEVAPPEQLADRNYIYFYDEPDHPGSGFGTGLVRLVETLETDLTWLREGTRLLQRATEWDEGRRSDGRLLFGDSIAGAKSWLARQPSNAPPPTALLLDYIRVSEEHDARRQSEERQRLAEREVLVRKAEAEQGEREAAQRREAEQARRAVRIRTIGLAVALVLAAVSVVAGFNAWRGQQALAERSKVLAERTSDLEAANERLGAEMRLRVAPFGKQAYEIPEQWYKLATTNASSVAFIEFNNGKQWGPAASGFVIRGKDLYPPWGEQPVFVTGGHIYYENEKGWAKRRARIRFPALKHKPYVLLDSLLWVTTGSSVVIDSVEFGYGADAAVFGLAEKLPSGVEPITSVSDLDVTQWPAAKFLPGGEAVEGSVLDRLLPLVTLGGTVGPSSGRNDRKLRLTLSLANALGRDQRFSGAKGKFAATDSTTKGSSGTPVFDASDGGLVGIIQYGTSDPKKVGDGLAYSGGTTMRAIKEGILADAAAAVDSSSRMFQEYVEYVSASPEYRDNVPKQNIELGEMYLALAQTRDATAAARLALVRAEAHFQSGAGKLRDGQFDAEAATHFATALDSNPRLAVHIDAAWSEEYVQRGEKAMRDGKIEAADALFRQALQKLPDNAKSISAIDLDSSLASRINDTWVHAYLGRGQVQLTRDRDDEAQAHFAAALQRDPGVVPRIDAYWAYTYVRRGAGKLKNGDVIAAKAQFELARSRAGDDRRHPPIKAAIARAWLRHGKAEEALADAEAYFALGDNGRDAAQLRGLVYLALNRPAEALKDLDQAVSLGHGRPVTYFARGRCHELTDNQAAAIYDYQIALMYSFTDEDDRGAQEQARTRLKALGVEPRTVDEPSR